MTDLDQVERWKQQYTDSHVKVLELRPELRRFAGKIGRVVTVNMNGRALVQFDSPEDRTWYDLELAWLEIVSAGSPP